MRRDPDIEDLRLWSVIAATVRPLRTYVPLVGRDSEPRTQSGDRRVGKSGGPTNAKPQPPAPVPPQPHPGAARLSLPMKGREAPEDVEKGLHRRIVRGREPMAARIDLHGLTFDAARAALTAFILRAADEGWRSVLVITGKGTQGDGVIRRHAPEWLAQPPLRALIAGVSQAHRRHGGEGALYVALKRKG